MKLSKTLIISLLTLIGLSITSGLYAQETDDLIIHGNVKDQFSRKKLAGATVTISENGSNIDSQSTSSNGKFEFFLNLGKVYLITCSKNGYVTKSIEVDTKSIPAEDKLGGFILNPDISIFEDVENIDFSILDKPIGKAKYVPEKGSIEWDMEYTRTVQAELDRLFKEVEKAQEDEDKDADKLEEQFNKFMADGESDMTKKGYESAVSNFEAALNLRPQDNTAKSRLDEANKKLEEKLAAEEEERKYNEFIDQGDNARSAKNWADAVKNYDSALGVRAKDKYATDEKKKAEIELDKLKEREADEATVAALIVEGDSKVDSEDFQGAIDKYEAALDIISGHPEATDKLAIAKKALAEYQAMASQRADYEKLIADADGLYEKEDFAPSISKYEAALNVMPKEAYPADQIKKAQDRLAELEALAKDEAERAARQGEFDALMASGDKNMSSTSYDAAISDYSAALKVFSDDAIAKEKLAAAEKAKADMLASAEADEQFAALIVDADRYFDKEDWEASIEKYQAALDVKADPYPTNRIVEAEAAIAERVRLAEEERLANEARLKDEEAAAAAQAEFDAFMDAGNDDFKNDSFESAITNYEGALGVFSDNGEAQDKLDKSRKALEDMLAQQEDDARRAEEEAAAAALQAEADAKRADDEAAAAALQAEFDVLIAEGDGYFEQTTYEEAIDSYLNAQKVLPENKEVKEKIDNARNELEKQRAAMNEAERLKAEQESAAAEQALRDQFNELVAQGDAAFQADTYQPAIDNYEEALGLIADDKPTQKKLEKAIRRLQESDDEAARLAAEEEKRSKEQAERDAAAEAEAARLAALEAERDAAAAAEAARLAAEQADADALARAAAEEEAARLEAIQAEREAAAQAEAERLAQLESERDAAERKRLDKEAAEYAYSQKIVEADELFDYKDYQKARRAYEEALDMRPSEAHPETRIAMIDQLMADAEEANRLRAEREERLRQESEKKGYTRGPDLDSELEEEIAARIAEERQKQLQEKWDANERRKQEWADQQADLRRGEGSRIEDNKDKIEGYREYNAEIAEDANRAHQDKIKEVEDYKQDLQDKTSRNLSEQQERVLVNQENIDKKEATQKSFSEDYYANNSSYDEHLAQVKKIKETKEAIAKKGNEAYADKVEDSEDWKEDISIQSADRNQMSAKRRNERGEDIAEYKDERQQAQYDKTERLREENTDTAARKKELYQEAERERSELADERRALALMEAHSQKTYNGGKEVMDYVKSELADEFPQGVTEESFTEGNKDVIRRIVVVGNKATEYRKVTSVSGSYFFKNGQSISKSIWDLESDKVIE